MIGNNAYNTSDPQKLLMLRRLEADAILDVLRSINNPNLDITQLFKIARNLLRTQIDVRKMIFYFHDGAEWVEGFKSGFPSFSETAIAEIITVKRLAKVREQEQPHVNGFGAEYIVPIKNRDEVAAYFTIAEFADSEIEAQNDLIFVETVGNILSVAIENRRLLKETTEKEILERELQVAETIQQQLLISNFQRFKEIDVFATNEAYQGVGGDFYDIIKKGKGITFVCIADVSGKGIGAALLMSNLQANLRALCAQYSNLVDIIRELNQILFNITKGEKFVTLFLARINSKQKKVSYINAGHNHPLLVQDSKIQPLSSGCTILGILEELPLVEENTFHYHIDDLMFMFTDGVVEQENMEGHMFGVDPLYDLLPSHPGKNSKQIIQLVSEKLTDYKGDGTANDDITMLSVKFLK